MNEITPVEGPFRRPDRNDVDAKEGLFGVKDLAQTWQRVGETVQSILEDFRTNGVKITSTVKSPWGPLSLENIIQLHKP